MDYENGGYSYRNGAVFRKGSPLSALEEFAALDDLIKFLIERVGLSIEELVILLRRCLNLSASVIRNRTGLVLEQSADTEAEREATVSEPEDLNPW